MLIIHTDTLVPHLRTLFVALCVMYQDQGEDVLTAQAHARVTLNALAYEQCRSLDTVDYARVTL